MRETAVEVVPIEAYEAIAREMHRLGRLEEQLGAIGARHDAVGEGR